MTSSIESVTVHAVGLALDAAMLRHQAIAANIANAETPGYQPVRVSFEEQLGAAREALRDPLAADASSLSGIEPAVVRDNTPSPTGGTASVAIDEDVAKLSANTVHYQALLRALGKQFAILGMAANDGKR